jgi:hypothetical protein
MYLRIAALLASMQAIGAAAQSTALPTELEDHHKWYWLGHWHLWHGGWAYWWVMPLLLVVVGALMFYLGRLSVKTNRKPAPEQSVH